MFLDSPGSISSTVCTIPTTIAAGVVVTIVAISLVLVVVLVLVIVIVPAVRARSRTIHAEMRGINAETTLISTTDTLTPSYTIVLLVLPLLLLLGVDINLTVDLMCAMI